MYVDYVSKKGECMNITNQSSNTAQFQGKKIPKNLVNKLLERNSIELKILNSKPIENSKVNLPKKSKDEVKQEVLNDAAMVYNKLVAENLIKRSK